MTRRAAAMVFLAFAMAYFFSALLRAVPATLAPVFSAELGIGSADLGLLAGAYFLGFSLMQLPLGMALDRFGPKPVLQTLLTIAAAACVAFAMADQLWTLVLARALIGLGVSACLMAPLTCYRHLFTPTQQLRANSWMLMTGSLGMLASTVPVQMLLPTLGWRGLFWVLAALVVLSVGVIQLAVPNTHRKAAGGDAMRPAESTPGGYGDVLAHPLFRQLAPMGFVIYGGMIAVQALWAGPWLTRVTGLSPQQAAQGLFFINGCMLVAFMSWGALMPRLAARGFDAVRLVRMGVPLSLLLLAMNIILGEHAGPLCWALWCVSCTFITPSQPAVGMAFSTQMAGRALSAFNLVIFGGVFAIQWGIGLFIDVLRASGLPEAQSMRWAMAALWGMSVAAYLWGLRSPASPAAGVTGPVAPR